MMRDYGMTGRRYGREADTPIQVFKAWCCTNEGITQDINVRLQVSRGSRQLASVAICPKTWLTHPTPRTTHAWHHMLPQAYKEICTKCVSKIMLARFMCKGNDSFLMPAEW